MLTPREIRPDQKIMREVVTRRNRYGFVMESNLTEVTAEEIEFAQDNYSKGGVCNHDLVSDDREYMYDIRYCAICGTELGTV